jgi:hypothetical protein
MPILIKFNIYIYIYIILELNPSLNVSILLPYTATFSTIYIYNTFSTIPEQLAGVRIY